MSMEELSTKTRNNSLLEIGFAMGKVQAICSTEDKERVVAVLLAHMPFDLVAQFVDDRRAAQSPEGAA